MPHQKTDEANALLARIKSEISLAGGVGGYVSTLGGEHRPGVMLTFAFDPKSSWVNNILENSKYAKISFHLHEDPRHQKISAISGSGVNYIRQAKFKDIDDAMRLLTKWIAANS
jgi:hypothetical protein